MPEDPLKQPVGNLDLPKPETRQSETLPAQQQEQQTPSPSMDLPQVSVSPETDSSEKEKEPSQKPSIYESSAFSLPNGDAVSEPSVPKKRLPLKLLIFIFAGLALIIVAFLIFKLLTSKTETTDSVTIDYWGLWEPKPVIDGIIAQFEEEHPGVKVNYIQQDKEDFRARLQSSFSRGDGPDIFRFHNTWLPMLKNDLASLPETLVNDLSLKDDYFPIVSTSVEQNGVYYGVPLMIDTLALYYNKDILSRANKSPPRTWWGLENLAKELTVRPNQKITIAGAALGSVGNVDHWSDIVGLMIYQNGGDPAEPDELTEDVIKYYLRFKNSARVWDDSLPSSTTAFANGNLAFYFGPSWRIFNFQDANPNLNFGVTTVPQLPKLRDTDWEAAERGEAELTNINWATFWLEGVWLKGQHQEEAWQFLQFLGSSETLQKLYTAQSQVRSFGELYPRKSLAESLKQDPLTSPFVSQAQTAESWYLSSFTHDSGINQRIIKYYEDAVNAFEKPSGGTKALETLNSGVRQILNQYNVGR